MSIGMWNTETNGNAGCEDTLRKSIDIRLKDYSISAEKGQLHPFPYLPARTGAGRAH